MRALPPPPRNLLEFLFRCWSVGSELVKAGVKYEQDQGHPCWEIKCAVDPHHPRIWPLLDEMLVLTMPATGFSTPQELLDHLEEFPSVYCRLAATQINYV